MQAWQRRFISQNLPDLIQNTICNFVFLSKLTSFLSDEEHQDLVAKYTHGSKIEAANSFYSTAVTRHGSYEVTMRALFDTKQFRVFRTLAKGLIRNRNANIFQNIGISADDKGILKQMSGLDWNGNETGTVKANNVISFRRWLILLSSVITIFVAVAFMFFIATIVNMGINQQKLEVELADTTLNFQNQQNQYEDFVAFGKKRELRVIYLEEIQILNQKGTRNPIISLKSPSVSHEKASEVAISKFFERHTPDSSTFSRSAAFFLQSKYKEDINAQAGIAIDFGSRYSRSAIYFKGNIHKVPHYDKSGITYPDAMLSYVGVEKFEDCVGQCALDAIKSSTENVPIFYDIKEKLTVWSGFGNGSGDEFRGIITWDGVGVYNDPVSWSSTEFGYPINVLLSRLFKQLLQNAERFVGAPVTSCVITIPNDFHELQRAVVIDTSRDSGCLQTSLIEEDEAAAIAFHNASNSMLTERNLLIISLGAYYWRFTVLRKIPNSYEILSTNVIAKGHEIRKTLMYYCILTFIKTENVLNPNELLNDRKSNRYRRLFESCDTAIISLSTKPTTTIYVSDFYNGLHLRITISRKQFETNIWSVCRDIQKQISSVLNSANLQVDDIHEVIIAGGQSRIPKIQEIIKKYFTVELNSEKFVFLPGIEPEEIILYGAAVHGAILMGK